MPDSFASGFPSGGPLEPRSIVQPQISALRWNLLSEVLEIEPGRRARTLARLPQNGISPEFLMLEIMAQTAGLAFGAERDFKTDVVFAKIEQAAFEKLPDGASLLSAEATSAELRAEGAWFEAWIASGSVKFAQARLLILDVGHLDSAAQDSITFHAEFMNHYRVREKIRVPLRPV